ncbi:MAG: lactate permease LctP family transporter [Thermoanaerobacteraceae bacterium]|nr:lactate permease LctP family transporter [Thermoanaerobacteraceae bacterium]
MQFYQNYNPLGNFALSTLIAALPIIVLLYLLAIHPWKDAQGRQHRGILAPYAAAIAAATAIIISTTVVRMPLATAVAAFVNGFAFGMMPIGWIVLSAMFLYTMTLVTGKFEVVKNTVASITPDKRLQALLVAFSFGAFMEGAAGFGTPVAVAGAMMVGLGFRPLPAAVICLIANTAPVAWGAIGTPIITLAKVSGIPEELITIMAGRQLPLFSIIVPFWLVATLVFMNKGKWRDVWEVWPATLVCGLSFAGTQFAMSQKGNVMLVDIVSGIFSMIVTALFLKVWQPKRIITSEAEFSNGGSTGITTAEWKSKLPRYTTGEVVQAWLPWVLLSIAVFLWGLPGWKAFLNNISIINIPVPYLDNVVYRVPPVVPQPHPEAAVYTFNWLSAAGTGIFVSALVSGLFVLRLTGEQWVLTIKRTANRMKLPLATIGLVLGLGFTTRYSGLDAILGLAFTKTGWAYPFFASMLGWLGVFLTGSDTSSNAMFGSLQRITAEQLGMNPVLIVTANSTGGVMGKMIDAQSIVVSTAACYEDQAEGSKAVGAIFRAVVWHSLVLACMLSFWVFLQAYVFPWMIPPYTP